MEKIQPFVLTIAILLWIPFFTVVLLRLFQTKTAVGRELFAEGPWGPQRPQLNTFVTILWSIIVAPTIEELVFRMPLLILFDELTLTAWIAIVVTGVVFGFAHWSTRGSMVASAYADAKRSGHSADETLRLLKHKVYRTRFIECAIPSCVGIIMGCAVVVYQNIWIAVGIHFAWNLLTPLVTLLAVYFVGRARMKRTYREALNNPREPQVDALV